MEYLGDHPRSSPRPLPRQSRFIKTGIAVEKVIHAEPAVQEAGVLLLLKSVSLSILGAKVLRITLGGEKPVGQEG